MNNLPLPNLDDRRWADLVQEGLALIPYYAPQWTDHNVSDPGITLMELFAWLAEMDIYQLNRIPISHRLKFLALAGVRPEPPQAARTALRFGLHPLAAAVPPYPLLPAGLELETNDAFGEQVRFRTLAGLVVVPGEIQSLQSKVPSGFQDLTARWQRGESFLPFGEDPQPGAALYLGLDAPLPLCEPVSFYISIVGSQYDDVERMRLVEEMEAALQECRPPESLLTCRSGDDYLNQAAPRTSPLTVSHHSAVTIWEYLDERGRWRAFRPQGGRGVGRDDARVEDCTRSLTLSAPMRLAVVERMGSARLGQAAQPLYYLRCRFASGAYDAPPAVDALAINAVPGEQAVTPASLIWTFPGAPAGPGFRAEQLGIGTVAPGQTFLTSEKPVQETSFELYTLEAGRLQPWERRLDFDASSPADRHYTLDASQGWVLFGDGQEGRIPPEGVAILARYRTTRAQAGNLPAGAAFRLADSAWNRSLLPDFAWMMDQIVGITNPVPARGGAAGEDLEHAEGRAYLQANKVERAVTLNDIETLARETPGVRLARAWARANHHPAFPCFLAPGVITLVVMPYLPVNRPIPSRALCRRVAAYVSRRRVIGTRLEVVAPEYVEVTVRAVVQPQTGVSPAGLQQRIIAAIERFFHPLLGGPAAKGWPFGRDVYRSEVLQVIDETPGVEHVVSLELIAGGCEPQCANLCVGPVGLVFSGKHRIEIRGENG